MGGSFSSPTTVPETTPTTGTPEPVDRASNPSQEPESPKSEPNPKSAEENGEEEEEGECGFCWFMKSGNCKDAFINWQNCIKEVEDAEEEGTTKCSEASLVVLKCMEAHRDYYGEIVSIKEKFDEEVTIEAEGAMDANDSERKEGSKGEGLERKAVKDSNAEMASKDSER